MLIINATGRILAAPNPYSCFDKYQNTWITWWPGYTRIHQPKYIAGERLLARRHFAPDFSLHSESCPAHLQSSSSSEQDPISARQSLEPLPRKATRLPSQLSRSEAPRQKGHKGNGAKGTNILHCTIAVHSGDSDAVWPAVYIHKISATWINECANDMIMKR